MKTIAYVRNAAQRELIERWARLNGITISACYVERSQDKAQRPTSC